MGIPFLKSGILLFETLSIKNSVYRRYLGDIMKSTINNDINNISNANNKIHFNPKNVVILTKTTKLQYLLKKYKIKYEDRYQHKFVKKLEKIGVNINELEGKQRYQDEFVNEIVTTLKKRKINTKVVLRDDFNEELVNQSDLVISAGGDGTFLTAASSVSPKIPLIGINTDPIGSEGHLCIAGKANISPSIQINEFLDGNFEWMKRQRIRVKIIKSVNGSPPLSPNENGTVSLPEHINHHESLALNEVFIGETHAARVSYYELQIDDGPMLKQKSSGLTVCTGTGSSSWHYNINRITEQKMDSILDILEDLNIDFKGKRCASFVEEACNRFNSKLKFDPGYEKMSFSVRDPVFNSTFPLTESRGFCKSIRVKSRCSNAQIVLDGNLTINFNQGTEAILELRPEDSLITATLPQYLHH
uniref:NAD(+) kinase n=1 Tax=Strongyloides stercoralis TaxID=6248 RepID=A0A0K0EK07_STRER